MWPKKDSPQNKPQHRHIPSSYKKPTKLAQYARTRAMMDDPSLGYHYWEIHKQDNDQWRLNRVEIREEQDKKDPTTTDVFRFNHLQYYNLSFFEAVDKLASFEHNPTTPQTTYVGETVEELGCEHYEYVAEREGFIVFHADTGRPVYAPDGRIPEKGKFRETELQRAFDRAAEAQSQYPNLFPEAAAKKENIPTQQKTTPVYGEPPLTQPVRVSEGATVLAEILGYEYNFGENGVLFHQMSVLDDMTQYLRSYLTHMESGIKDPQKSIFRPNYDRLNGFHLALEDLDKIKKLTKDLPRDQRGNIINFINKARLYTHMTEIRAWNVFFNRRHNIASNDDMYKRYYGSALYLAVKECKKQKISNMTEHELRFTVAQQPPKLPKFVTDFISTYERWKRKQIDVFQNQKRNKPTP